MANYFRFPFANSGDKAAIPQTVQPDGSVSYPDGFGIDYQLDPDTDPDALNIPRLQFNQLMYAMTLAIQQYQQLGFPDFITTSDNGGSPFSYAIGAHVRYDDGGGFKTYYSLVGANTALPTDTTKWGLVIYAQPFMPGDMLPWGFATIRTGGWLWLNGTTIGDGTSGGTQRANADTQTLFTMLWTDYTNAVLPIQDSSGAASTRGANAAADFAAHKRMPLPDLCGRTIFGQDNMGGITAKGRITNALSGINGVTLGAVGGIQSVQLAGNQNGAHVHTGTTDSGGIHDHTATTSTAGAHIHTGGTNLTGAHTHGIFGGNGGFFSNTPTVDSNTTARTAATASAGDHQHVLNIDSAGAHTHPVTVDSGGAHTHTFTTDSSGLGLDHQNMPPTFIGGWIVKY